MWWGNLDLSCLSRTIYARLNFAPFEQKWVTQPIILTPSRPVGCLTHECQAPSWEAKTFHFSHLWCDTVCDRIRAFRTPSGRSTIMLRVACGLSHCRIRPCDIEEAMTRLSYRSHWHKRRLADYNAQNKPDNFVAGKSAEELIQRVDFKPLPWATQAI